MPSVAEMNRFRIAVLVAALGAATACSSDGDTSDAGATTAVDAATGSDTATATATDADTASSESAPAAELAAAPESVTSSDELPTEEPADDGISIGDSCEALTEQEISDATGISFAPGAPSTIADADFQDACDWVSDDGMATAQVIIVDDDVYESNRSSAAAVSDTVDVDVDGTDAAYATFDGAIVGMRLGERFVQVAVITSDGVDRSAAVLELAALVVGRL